MIEAKHRGTRLVAVVLLALLALMSCDRVYGPVVYNSLGSTLAIEIRWEDGRSTSVDLASRELVHAGIADHAVREIEISSPDRVIQVLSADDLRELAGTHDVRSAGFVIDESGVRLMSQNELDRVVAERGKQ